jgi:hypothetical protein
VPADCWGGPIISRGWGPSARGDLQLTYMVPVVMAAEFALDSTLVTVAD